MSDRRPVVAVWRSLWLPPSETFVADHLTSLQRWRPLPIGLYRQDHGLGPEPARAPFARTGLRRQLCRVSGRMGYPGVYSDVFSRHRPRLVHAHFGTDAVQALKVARRYRLPLVVTFHGYDATSELRRGDYVASLREVFDYAGALLPVSQFLADRLLAVGAPPQRTHVHHLGIAIDPKVRPAPASTRQGITFVGRLIESKGVGDLLAALALLPPGLRARTPVTIIGDGPLRARLEEEASRLPDARITFTGRLTPERVAAALAGTRVLAGPSTIGADGSEEAFGLVFAEASRAGAPVVGYASGGVGEAVLDGETGLLAAVGDLAGLAEHLTRVLTDDDLADRLGRNGHHRVLTSLDLRSRTSALEDIYDRVCAGRE